MRVGLVAIMILLLAVPATAEEAKTVRIGAIDWYTDYDAALTVAREREQPMWLHFGENPG